MRIVFLGSPPFATPILAALIERGGHELAAVVTAPERSSGRGRRRSESPVAALARAAGIELLAPESMADPAVRERLREIGCDVLCVASYGEILDAEILGLPRIAPINVHGSLLPRHRGASPVQAAILAGDAETGVSVQRMVEALDAGDVMHRIATPIGPDETAGELFGRLAELGAQALLEALELLAAGAAEFVPQDDAAATVCHKLKKRRGRLRWKQPAPELERRVRAMHPWPGAFTELPEAAGPLKVHRARIAEAVGAPGEVGPELAEGRLVVGCGAGALELLEVQPAGKRAMPTADFLRGARITAGELLGAVRDRC